MSKRIGYILLFVLIFLLVINTANAMQYSKINSVQDCLDLYEGDFSCFQILAEKTNDISLCDYPVKEPVSVNRRNECIESIAIKTKDVAVCDRFTGEKKGYCIFRVAEAMQDASVCALISEDLIYTGRLPQMKLRDACQYEILRYKTNDCSELWDNRARDLCYLEKCQTVECCQNIKGASWSEVHRNKCIAKVGQQTGDLSLCIQTQDGRCFAKAIEAMESPSPALCDQFKNTEWFLPCIGSVANNIENPKLCLQALDNKENIDRCLNMVKHIEACKLMTDVVKRDKCAEHIALFTSHNPDDCNVISDATVRQECRRSLNVFSQRSNPIIDVLIMLIIAGLYFVILRHDAKYLPWVMGLAVVFVQRIFLLIVPFINILMETQPVTRLLAFTAGIRFTDWFMWAIQLRKYFPYNWLFLLTADIITLLLVVLVGYLAQKKGISVVKTTLIFVIILVIIAIMLLLSLAAMLSG